MVERIKVLLCWLSFLVIPLRVMSRLLTAASYSSCVERSVSLAFSYSSCEMTCFLYNSSCLANVVFSCSRVRPATLTLDSAAFRLFMSGITLMRAMISSFLTISPASLSNSAMIPEIWGLIRISLRASTLPVATVFFSMLPVWTVITSYVVTTGLDLFQRNTKVPPMMATRTTSKKIRKKVFMWLMRYVMLVILRSKLRWV